MRSLFAIFLFTATPVAMASEACWERAAMESGTTVELLRAIAWTESSMQPHAVNTSHEHVTGTRDVGLVGVNTAPRVLQRLGVSESDLFNPCTNLRAGARILREKFGRYGVTWEAVGAYNAACTRLKAPACHAARATYAWRVYRAMHKPPCAPKEVCKRLPRQATRPAEPMIQFVSFR